MIHTKLLIRRLAYVPWLLAAGLLLGWAGEAAAQTAVTLELDKKTVREDASSPVTITAKAKVAADAAADINVTLQLNTGQAGLNDRFRITLPTITIPKGKKEGTAALAFSPVNDKLRGTDYLNNNTDTDNNDIIDDDLNIVIIGNAGGASFPVNATATPAGSVSFILVDDDKLSTEATLSFSPGDLSKDAGDTPVTVTATLNGSLSKNKESFDLVFTEDTNGDGTVDTNDDDVLDRDVHYTASLGKVTISKRKPTGKGTINIDPRGNTTEDGKIALDASMTTLTFEGVDLNADGDTGDTYALATSGSQEAQLTEALIGLDIDGDGNTNADEAIGESTLLIDLNGDGLVNDDDALNGRATNDADGSAFTGANLTEIKESDLIFSVAVAPGLFTIKKAPLAAVKGDGLAASPASIREDQGQQTIELTVTLDKEAATDEAVTFKILPVADAGERDRDYIVSVDDLTINKGEKSGKADLTVTPDNNPGVTGNRQFTVQANFGGAQASKTITIVDVNTFSQNITLSAEPGKIKEDADADSSGVPVMITATLDGKTFDEDKTLTLALRVSGDGKGTATRDVDYTAKIYSVTIDSGMVSGSRQIRIYPIYDKNEDKDETIKVMSTTEVKNGDEEVVKIADATITLTDVAPPADPPAPGDNKPSFSADDMAGSDTIIEGEVGRLGLSMTELPAAMDGDAPLAYSVSTGLPAGLTFDADTRTISGTPTTAGDSKIVYTVVDKNGDAAALTYTIEIAPEPKKKIMVDSVSATQTTIRENDGATDIEIKAKLAEAAPVAGTIWFTLQPSEAVRDVDYRASIGGTVAVDAGDTQATTTLTLDPIDNDENDGNKDLTVQAAANGSSSTVDITIADDEEASTGISLSADPNTISENAGTTAVTITATLNGKVLDADALLTISIDPDSDATRDEDYSATFEDNNPRLTIATGAISGSVVLNITPVSDGTDEGNQTITLNGKIGGGGLNIESGSIILEDAAEMVMPDPLAFTEGAMIDSIKVTVGAEVSTGALPEAMGGDGDITYSVSGLPAGLEFDAATRMISGSPTEEGTSEVTYTASAGEEEVSLSFSVTVNPPLVLDLGSLFGLSNGAGKANPAHDPDAEAEAEDTAELQVLFTATVGEAYTESPPLPAGISITGLPSGLSLDGGKIVGTPTEAGEFVITAVAGDQSVQYKVVVEEAVIPTLPDQGVVGQPFSLQLGELGEGISYSVSGLPAGLSFEAATRTISGTPTVAGESILTVEAAGYLTARARLVVRNLDAPSAVMAQDYPNDNSGFILLSWELSEDHAVIDGYRIFRALPALDGELVPWAMVDAVPGQDHGYAIVATIDLVATKWGVAAEQGGVSTDIVTTKAAFVRAEDVNQPYELMAETLMASREAAKASDGPVFATLLPEAVAFAQGVIPNLKSIEGGVQLSAITMTEEAVRPIDNIAPLAVPSLSVLDAPNDTGNRIALTWALSPSDGVLQEVVAGATGPTTVEPVAGVHGYAIYRRAAMGEEEFVMVGQVEAGATEFVDETALNGVRYIYQVRPFDVDNETPKAENWQEGLTETAIAVRNNVPGLFGSDNSVGFDDFFLFADHFGLTADDPEYDPAFDLDLNRMINEDDYNLFVAAFGNSTDAAGKRVPMLAGLNADARMYLAARTAMPSVGEEFVLDVSLADFMAVKGYGLQMQYDASKLEFVEARTEQPLGGSELAAPQVLADEAGVLTVASYGDVVSEGEVALSLVFRPTAEIEATAIEITDSQTYDSEFGFNRLALPAPVQVQTRPEVFALANNFPNPFNPATTIKYALPQAADVHLTVYNVVGQVVRTLVAEHQNAGRYVVEWDATNDSGHSLSSGMYFYRLEAGGEFREVKKMLLLK